MDCWPSLDIQIYVLLWLVIHSMDFLVKNKSLSDHSNVFYSRFYLSNKETMKHLYLTIKKYNYVALRYHIDNKNKIWYNDPRPITNQSISLKSGLTLLSVCFILYVRTYVCTDGRTPSPKIMNRFSSLCFDLWLDLDQNNM